MHTHGRERWFLGVFFVLILIAFGGLIWRVYDLKANQHDGYVEMSQNQQHAFVPEQPRRGMLLDCRGRILAASVESYSVYVEPRRVEAQLEGIKVVSAELQEALQIPGYELCEMISQSSNPGYLCLKKDISPQQYQAINAIRAKASQNPSQYGLFAGIGIESDWKRQYPAGNLTGHILGFVGRDEVGLAGLELGYDTELSGQMGREVLVVDAFRRPIAEQLNASSEVTDGHHLILTIDSVIQRFVYEALKQKLEEYEAESAVGIVMDPWTGGILAMVSLPDFNPLDFSDTPQDRMRNRILTDTFEPGSIFKPIVAAAGLESGAIGFTDKFDCEDGYWARYKIGEFGNHQYGILSTKDVLVHSSNVGMAKMGIKMGQQKLYDGLKMLGFSERTGIDLPGEDPGLLRPLSKWSGYSVTRIPFGHEVSATALQICRAYCIFANGGYAVKPHIVRAVVDSQGQIIEDRQPSYGTAYILRKEVADWMVRKALSDVVNEGTGDMAKLDGCQVWGKTGTANIALPTGGYDTQNYIASFAGGAPEKDPAVVVLVSIRKPNRSLGKGYSGGRVAAPVVHDILENTLTYLGVLEEKKQELSTQLARLPQ